MAEVQNRALAILALIGRDHLRLDRATAQHRAIERGRVASQQRVHVIFEPREEFRIANDAVLDDFGEAGEVFARRKRAQRIHVGEHQPRLVKRADHVFPLWMVDRGLAAHRRVDLREQRRRHLNQRDAALISRRDEARDVADHAAPERDERRRSIVPMR